MWSWYHYTGTETVTFGPFVLHPNTVNGLPVRCLELAPGVGIDPTNLIECPAPWVTEAQTPAADGSAS